MAGTTTIELPIGVRDRLKEHKQHNRQAYHEVITRALDALEAHRSDGRDSVLEEHRAFLRNLCSRHGIDVRIVGSRARAEAAIRDDLDVVAHLGEGRSLFDLAAFQDEAEARIGVALHVKSRDAIPTAERKKMLRQAVRL